MEVFILKKDILFWIVAVLFVLASLFDWVVVLKIPVIVAACALLIQVAIEVFRRHRKEM